MPPPLMAWFRATVVFVIVTAFMLYLALIAPPLVPELEMKSDPVMKSSPSATVTPPPSFSARLARKTELDT